MFVVLSLYFIRFLYADLEVPQNYLGGSCADSLFSKPHSPPSYCCAVLLLRSVHDNKMSLNRKTRRCSLLLKENN